MALDISGLYFFMPVFSFLFVFVIVYALLAKIKIMDNHNVNLIISAIVAIIFMSFSSLELYVKTIVPWFAVLVVIVFLVLALGLFTSKDWNPKSWFAWIFVIALIIIFLISAIKVFNPVFHSDSIIASGKNTNLVEQIRDYADGEILGSIVLVIIAGIVAKIITKK